MYRLETKVKEKNAKEYIHCGVLTCKHTYQLREFMEKKILSHDKVEFVVTKDN